MTIFRFPGSQILLLPLCSGITPCHFTGPRGVQFTSAMFEASDLLYYPALKFQFFYLILMH